MPGFVSHFYEFAAEDLRRDIDREILRELFAISGLEWEETLEASEVKGREDRFSARAVGAFRARETHQTH